MACFAAFPATEALAWGPDGHRIVCRIAYQLLDAPRQHEIARLTSTYRDPDGAGVAAFTDGCVLPDEARVKARNRVPGWNRFDPFDTWHFLNVPRTTLRVGDDHCPGTCVLTGIAHHAGVLAQASTDQERAEALFFLGHWVGDIHQPLHTSYADDLGGNGIKLAGGGFYTSGNLHAVWDSGILANAIGLDGWRIHADRLARLITPARQSTWVGGPAVSWAQESYNLATSPGTQYCTWRTVDNQPACVPLAQIRTLAASYQAEHEDDVEVRLQQAGTRLADLIRRSLAVP